MQRLLLSLLLVACGPEPQDPATESAGGGSGGGREIRPCEDTYIYVDGPEIAQVGLTWVLTMRCIYDDGTESTVIGPMIVRAEPHGVVRADDNHITFLEPGEVMLRLQIGSLVERIEVTVLE